MAPASMACMCLQIMSQYARGVFIVVKHRILSTAILGGLSLALLLDAVPAWSAMPSTVNIHGQLLDASGEPLVGNRAWQVKFFGAQTGGTQLGATLTGTVTVSAEGVFDIPVTPPQEALSAAQPWYELAVDGTPTPNGVDTEDVFPQRVAVHSVPFALEANHVAVAGVGAGTVSDTEFGALDGVTSGIQAQINLKANTADIYTKTAIDTAIAVKANTADVYTKAQMDTSLAAQTAAITAKANAADVYTKAQVDTAQAAQDTAIAAKANTSSVYTKTQVNNSQAAQDTIIAAKANTADVYNKAEVDGKMFSWTVVNGADVQAVANHGYVITDTAERSIVLPSSESLAAGDIVRVTGAGPGGWRLAQNDGQQISTTSLQIPNSGNIWGKYANTSTWRFIAASSDGVKLTACASGGQIHTSTDSGASWTPRGPSGLNWRCIASSADGNKLVAGNYGGKLHTSTDSGVTWTERGADNYWLDLASSPDGTILYASTNGDNMYVSTDSGETWTRHGYSSDSPYAWMSVIASPDGTKAIATEDGMFQTTDSGETWTRITTAPGISFNCIAGSDDFTKLVAGGWNQGLYTSTDSGVTWTQTGPTNKWVDLACSSDGTKFFAVSYPGQACMSTDSGATWTPCVGDINGFGVAASGDFSTIAVTAEGDGIYLYSSIVTQTSSGTAGALFGGAGTAVELQHIGGGAFMPISHEGTLGVE